MEENRLNYLLQQYVHHQCNAGEKNELALLIAALKDEDLKKELLLLWDKEDTGNILSMNTSQRILSHILSGYHGEVPSLFKRKKTRTLYIRSFAVAASVLLLISVGILVKQSYFSRKSVLPVAEMAPLSPQKEAPYIRNLTLPDGSTVILQAGSTIFFPDKFSSTQREVTLRGEAYFDIVHRSAQPFIIHTGVVKTTVLGTAFNIKAWPREKNITVSVIRGRVKVENKKVVLAVLTRDQQVLYNLPAAEKSQQTVHANKIVTDWTKQDMNFDGTNLENIAQVLSKRYGVHITVSNPQLANTQIVSSFSGTESLTNILDILCTINVNTRYIIQDDKITITNK